MKPSTNLNRTDWKKAWYKGLSSRVYINQYEKEKDPRERCTKNRLFRKETQMNKEN